MRPIWKGAISFGLVNIPVGLYTATRTQELKFRLIRASDLSPVNYKRVAEADGQEVPWDQIVKGYEYEKGQFVVLRPEDFERVDVEATGTVEITEFVQQTEVDPMYFQKPYYLEPGKGGEKAYALLREALRATGKIGIAKVVIKTREHLAAVKPHGQGLVLELMHFAEEILDPSELKIPDRDVAKKELDMAKALIDGMTTQWDPSRYEDDYREALQKVIDEKIAHPEAVPGKAKKPKRPPQTIDLVSVLQESLDQQKKKPRKPKAA